MKVLALIIGLFSTLATGALAQSEQNLKCVKKLEDGLATLNVSVDSTAGRHSFSLFLDSEKKFHFGHTKQCGIYATSPSINVSHKGKYLIVTGKTVSNCRINILKKSMLTFVKTGNSQYPLVLESIKYGQIFSEAFDFSNLKLIEIKKLKGAICKFI